MAWMRDNNTSKWSYGIRFVHWSMNTTYHEAIGMEPYKAMTGNRPSCGLKSILPTDFLDKIFTETIVSPGNDNPDAESNHLPLSMAESSLDNERTHLLPMAESSLENERTHLLPMAESSLDNERTHLLPMAESSLDNERTHLLPLAESSLGNESTHIFPCTTTPLGNDSAEEILSDLIRGKDPELHHTNVSNFLLSDFRRNDSHPARRA
ncbi:hypothetical protein LOD99_9035 [Oopsacas minuta]|uniref:Uncharacterized protein n=1 Tax=Oopsacas minuta TaxID=111878 RepID=A0AAV7JDY9_9METZ|nr:hypothetical protein LOD99_9035 [Oopsacas minuta]